MAKTQEYQGNDQIIDKTQYYGRFGYYMAKTQDYGSLGDYTGLYWLFGYYLVNCHIWLGNYTY